MWHYITLFLFFSAINACVVRKEEFGPVCVCNSTYCDTIVLGKVSSGTIKAVLTSNASPGFNIREEKFGGTKQTGVTVLKINSTVKYQTILGFGGAFTDSTGHNIKLLPEAAQKKLMDSYFADDGIEYNMMRVPVGGADFSPNFYTLDEFPNDMDLSHFALHSEDLNHKLPFMQQAFAARRSKQLYLFASAWTIPSWMTYSPGYTIVKKTHYQVYANYYKRYFDEYAKHGIWFWGMTTQNEAMSGLDPWNILGVFWVPQDLNEFIRDYLGPTLQNSSHDIRIIMHDDAIHFVPFNVYPIVQDEKTLEYVDGTAIHWYSFGMSPFEVMDLAKSPKKDLLLLNTEACYFITRPFLGDWGRASNYARIVMEHLLNNFHSWIDWNLAVNASGGPNNLNWNADAPIIISADQKEFYKQPYFYVFGHFTKFVPPHSVRVQVDIEDANGDLKVLAFNRPDGLTAVLVSNQNNDRANKIQIVDSNRMSQVLEIPAASFQTFLFGS